MQSRLRRARADSQAPALTRLDSEISVEKGSSKCTNESRISFIEWWWSPLPPLLHHKDVPVHLQDNVHIHTGYRAFYSNADCLRSVFAIHNESMNIWLHLIGAVLFCILWHHALISWHALPEGASSRDYWVFGVYLATAFQCLTCSTLFHTFSACEHMHVFDRMAILDYMGIAFLIYGSNLITLYYGLYCHPVHQLATMIVITLTCCSGLVLPWFSFFRANEFRFWRTMFFVSMGAIAFACCLQTLWLVGLDHVQRLAPLRVLLTEALMYLAGAFIYMTQVPERWLPGRLDIWFHSHQVWHGLVLTAAATHYFASVEMLKVRLSADTCSPDWDQS